jgi:hypothetical protein
LRKYFSLSWQQPSWRLFLTCFDFAEVFLKHKN